MHVLCRNTFLMLESVFERINFEIDLGEHSNIFYHEVTYLAQKEQSTMYRKIPQKLYINLAHASHILIYLN
jgi:hypothetical protein